MDTFNHFRIKRQAHNISRQGSEAWNPFQHVSWRPQRAESWNGGRLEEQREGNGQEDDLTHAATSPFLTSGSVRDISTSGTGQDTEEAAAKQASEDSHDIPLIDKNLLRNRKGESNIFESWLNLFLPLIPVGIALHIIRGNTIETFIVNFFATFPLQNMAAQGLDEIQLRLGKIYGSLLYITTFNLFQLISSILLLVNKEIVILQTTLIGGILANILLILGLSFIAGGFRRPEQFYNITTAHVSSNLLSLSATSLLIPTASKLLGQTSDENLAKQSRGASFLLILVYILFLVYQFKTHHNVFSEESQKVPATPWGNPDLNVKLALRTSTTLALNGIVKPKMENLDAEKDVGEDENPQLYLPVAILLFLASNVALFFLVDYVVNSINGLATTAQLSRTFIGLILLPIPNCDPYAIYLAVKDEVDHVITCTIGKCIQTALCITPFITLLAWWLDIQGVTLVFDGFEIVSLFAAILLLNFVVSPGKDHW
ncbi:Calcium/proton exchanger [Trichoderma guizhouense]|uniref:Calcium/proton exchanger n=1 Tax=Trichoderma guizhouense TaxID=1491466 RepID=A0A1T3CEX3_9HYPO|nr:Calcium/proton exchanger [Trichoderma guizhouense]